MNLLESIARLRGVRQEIKRLQEEDRQLTAHILKNDRPRRKTKSFTFMGLRITVSRRPRRITFRNQLL